MLPGKGVKMYSFIFRSIQISCKPMALCILYLLGILAVVVTEVSLFTLSSVVGSVFIACEKYCVR